MIELLSFFDQDLVSKNVYLSNPKGYFRDALAGEMLEAREFREEHDLLLL